MNRVQDFKISNQAQEVLGSRLSCVIAAEGRLVTITFSLSDTDCTSFAPDCTEKQFREQIGGKDSSDSAHFRSKGCMGIERDKSRRPQQHDAKRSTTISKLV
jgi:hypothetical protein